ncbi:profilin [Magnaporthiopsis poae ATCC 64411]|uniref:Profilin n=1 Tax=Magnaporthiopsis poae (strain ATCC 64411 / 73-15) TaxID=644358 RepID=A0A0C4DPN8_MAGP6|nr:profilin [Magnaporthiopsis poae ATCC 64411]
MSWQAYVDSSLVGTGHIDKAAIISAAGDSEWATSAGFKLEASEMKNIADILSNTNGARDRALAEGMHICKERYVVTTADDNSIYARQGRSGICIAKSQQAILVGHHNEQAIAGNAVAATGALVDYLKPLGY